MEKNKEDVVVVFNSSPIINLSKINCLYLIDNIYGKILIPEAVYDEVIVMGRNKDHVKEIDELVRSGIIEKVAVKNQELVKAFRKDLDYGESEVLALALQLDADLVVIDETDARNIAKIYDLNITGFIGILIKAYQLGIINSVIHYLDLAIENGFRINNKLYEYISNLFD